MCKKKLMILSDSPLGSSGLGRIARELAVRAVQMPEIEVGFAGLGGTWGSNLPFPFYPLQKSRGYVMEQLPEVWKDFAGDQRGVLLTIWNHTWLYWLTDPRCVPPEMRDWITSKPFDLWGYIPVDSTRSDGTLPMVDSLRKFDRLLAYTDFGAKAISKTFDLPGSPSRYIDHLPHGLDTDIFYPQDRDSCRRSFGLPTDQQIIGVVATNSDRKDWGLAFEIASQMKDAILWCHTDQPSGPEVYWDLHDLKKIHGLTNVIITTFHYRDDRMAQMYSAMDVTLGPGNGGWELPLAESLACGTPVVTMDWAGQTEFVPKPMRIPPVAFHQIGAGSFLKPVHDVRQWVNHIHTLIPFKQDATLLDPKFEWQNCWTKWEQWIKEGL